MMIDPRSTVGQYDEAAYTKVLHRETHNDTDNDKEASFGTMYICGGVTTNIVKRLSSPSFAYPNQIEGMRIKKL